MKPLIVGNWKMHKTIAEAVSFVQQAGEELHRLDNVDVVLCPPYLALPVLEGLLRGTSVGLGAQDVAPWKDGAYTGEVSATMLAGHCQYVIVGHSERRRLLQETPALVNDKIKRCVEAGLQPIVCVSDEDQLMALAEVKDRLSRWIVAYEPVASIGTGKEDDPADVTRFVSLIRKQFGKDVCTLYGGSVEPDSAKRYVDLTNGVLVGGASLEPDTFMQICQRAAK